MPFIIGSMFFTRKILPFWGYTLNSELILISHGVVYAHPFEGLVIDTIAFTLDIIISGLTPRQVMIYNFLDIWKAMSDHCGYVLLWNPFN